MTLTPRLDIIGAALGDQSRARIICALMDGRAHTGKELAIAVGIAPNTASGHLQRLRDAGLILAERNGRTVYHRIASAEVADLLERMSVLSPPDHLHRPARRGEEGIRGARTCYNHIAGRLGVMIADQLLATGVLVQSDGIVMVGPARADVLVRLGLRNAAADGKIQARTCLDWTERRPHLSGPLAVDLLEVCLRENWLNRRPGSRVLDVTNAGRDAFLAHFAIPFDAF